MNASNWDYSWVHMVVEPSSEPRVDDFLGFYKIIPHQSVTTLPIQDISTQNLNQISNFTDPYKEISAWI